MSIAYSHLRNHIMGLMNSYSMIFFSNNLIFASVLLLVSFFDPIAGLSGMLAVLFSNILAQIMGYNMTNIISGLYGFNSLLIGLGFGNYFQFSFQFLVLLLVASLITLLFTVFMEGVIGKYGLPFLTLPFLLSFWIITIATRQYVGLQESERGIFMYNELVFEQQTILVQAYQWFNELNLPTCWRVYFKSLSAIFFQYHLFAGLLIAAGLIYYSRIAFLLSLIGYFSAYYFYIFIGAGFDELNYYYIGFNYILTAIAIGGFFIVSSRSSFLWVILLTPFISVLISSTNIVLSSLQLSALSLPFNLVVLIFLYSLKFRETAKGRLELVLFQEYSPERNLYSRINYKNRFGNNYYMPITLPFHGEWTVSQAHSGEFTHQEKWKHAWDFVITGADGKQYSNSGLKVNDYYCYAKPILAPADGYVVEISDNIKDNAIGEVNLTFNWGNTIVIKHAEGLYSQISHILSQSFKVNKGDYVKQGQIIALCGNSGRSPYPHIHFQLQSTPFIGSSTLEYPIGEYVIRKDNVLLLRIHSSPLKNDILSNIQPNNSIENALAFVPGQIVMLDIETTQGAKNTLEWEVKTDLYNQTYFYCPHTNSKAWFYCNNHQFYFTWFKGNRNSLLFDFYCGLFRLTTGFHSNLFISDELPLTLLKSRASKVLQDFIAPFGVYSKYEYRMKYLKMNDLMNQDEIEVESEVSYRLFWRKSLEIKTRAFFSQNRLSKIVFDKKGKTINVTFRSGNN